MDPLILRYYERELHYIREMGEEFSQEYPKIAGRLGIDGTVTSDPYVERLYEGFAFLAARIHLRIDSEYPHFTENLLNVLYPQYLAPTPSMAVIKFQPGMNAGFESGAKIPRFTSLRANRREEDQTACEYRTAHDVTLWPIAIKRAEYITNVASYTSLLGGNQKRPKAGIRLRIASLAQQPLSEIDCDALDVHLSGHEGQAARLYEQILGNRMAVVARKADSKEGWRRLNPANVIDSIGFGDNQALFPEDGRIFSGYRLLREYFAFPERYLFFRLQNLREFTAHCDQPEMDLVILLDRHDPELDNRVDATNFQLFCSPVINLFSKRADRIHISNKSEEYHVIPDRTRPMDFEIYQIDSAIGHGTGNEVAQTFLPMYATNRYTQSGRYGYYNVRRARRQLSEKQRQQGARSSYIGSECFVALVDQSENALQTDLKQLGIQALCTNRDLPLRIPIGQKETDFALDVSAPVASIRCIKGPTKPKPSLASSEGKIAWRLINQLSLNYLSLVDSDRDGTGAAALKELLSLYCDLNDAAARKQIDGIVSIASQQITRRIPIPGPIAFGRGLEIKIVMEEGAFVGTGVFLLGAVLEQFFARYVSINSFTETVICSEERGEIFRWPARIGQRQIV